MLPKIKILQKLSNSKIVAVIRGKTAEEALNISNASLKGGVNAIEVTYTTPNAGDVIRDLAMRDELVGAGTVLDAETARDALLHGANFIVSPHFNQEISRMCNRYAIPYLPGCLTITEMVQALEHGCDVLKLFPANNFNPSFIKSVNGPLPQIQLMPTGGINEHNFMEWLQAGAFAVGVGSDLSKAFHEGGEDAVIKQCNKYVNLLKGE